MGVGIIGLPEDAPERLTTPAGSFVEMLPREEWRPLRAASFALRLSFFPMLLVGLLVVTLGEAALRVYDDGNGPEWARVAGGALVALAAGVVFLCIALALFNQRVRRWGLFRLIRARPGIRFRPDRGSVIAAVEDAGTFEVTKMLPDDNAVIHLSREGIDMEMSRARVHLASRDIRLAVEAEGNQTGVNLSAELEGWTWAITLVLDGMLIGLSPVPNWRGVTRKFLERVGDEVDPRLVRDLLEADRL